MTDHSINKLEKFDQTLMDNENKILGELENEIMQEENPEVAREPKPRELPSWMDTSFEKCKATE